MSAREVTNSDDYIDSRDVTERIEELEKTAPIDREPDEQDELDRLYALAEEAEAAVGTEWDYGVTLIRDSYFEEYAQELAEDIGAIDRDARWPLNRIDWAAAAEDLKVDYQSIDFDGVLYWTR